MGRELDEACALHERGQLKEAEKFYRSALKREPKNFRAWNLLGVLYYQRGRFDDAVSSLRRALALNLDYAEAHNNLGLAQAALKRLDIGVKSYRRAIELKPDYADAHMNLGSALRDLGQRDEAAASYRRAVRFAPNSADAHFNLGLTLFDLSRPADAIESYRRAIEINPGDAEAHCNLGVALTQANNLDAALASYRQATLLAPAFSEAHYNLANALTKLNRLDEAAASYRRTIELKPNFADAYYNLATALIEIGRIDDAIAALLKMLEISPGHLSSVAALAFCHRTVCNWEQADRYTVQVAAGIAAGDSVEPFLAMALGLSPADQFACASRYARKLSARVTSPALGPYRAEASGKIKLAYLSADFRDHPVGYAIAELLERHDRDRFEILGVSIGPDDGSRMRSRLIGAFDQFHEASGLSDYGIARMIHDRSVQIVIDLGGYTRNSRPGILLHRPAPIQVNYLGYCGTMGGDFADYIIADDTALPFEEQPYFAEKIVQLRDSFFVSDSTTRISPAPVTRQAAGLPEGAFVYCCFNQSYKLTAPVFRIWMDLLRGVGHAILWLPSMNAAATANLQRQAELQGIDPARIIFAKRLNDRADHLARLRLADLFLDTAPYNAHATACDALWAGVPVLTCKGEAFPGRVSASLLKAVGLPELAMPDHHHYQATALDLATDPSRLKQLRQRLESGRLNHPLFATDRFRQQIEAAFTEMWNIQSRGEAPRSFAV